MSYSDISRATNLSKSRIFRLLKGQPIGNCNHKTRVNTTAAYGHIFLNGELVPDPKEQNVIQLIIQRWRDGCSFKDIAQSLNCQKFVTKTGKPWTYFAVRTVVNRHNSQSLSPKEPL